MKAATALFLIIILIFGAFLFSGIKIGETEPDNPPSSGGQGSTHTEPEPINSEQPIEKSPEQKLLDSQDEQIADQSDTIRAHLATINDLTGQVEALENELEGIEDGYEEAQQKSQDDIAALEENLAAMEGTISDLNGILARQEQTINDQNEELQAIQDLLDQKTTIVEELNAIIEAQKSEQLTLTGIIDLQDEIIIDKDAQIQEKDAYILALEETVRQYQLAETEGPGHKLETWLSELLPANAETKVNMSALVPIVIFLSIISGSGLTFLLIPKKNVFVKAPVSGTASTPQRTDEDKVWVRMTKNQARLYRRYQQRLNKKRK